MYPGCGLRWSSWAAGEAVGCEVAKSTATAHHHVQPCQEAQASEKANESHAPVLSTVGEGRKRLRVGNPLSQQLPPR